MFKKAQAAMEFLMTYGWAILIVLIVLAALFYLGIFSPRSPNVCIAIAPITCPDVKADAGLDTIALVLAASGVSTATITSYDLTSPAAGSCASATITPSASVPTTGPQLRSCDPGVGQFFTAGQKFAGTATILYNLQGSSVSHKTTVQYSGTVE